MTPHCPYNVVDLTHTLNEQIPSWHEGCGFKHKGQRKLCVEKMDTGTRRS